MIYVHYKKYNIDIELIFDNLYVLYMNKNKFLYIESNNIIYYVMNRIK